MTGRELGHFPGEGVERLGSRLLCLEVSAVLKVGNAGLLLRSLCGRAELDSGAVGMAGPWRGPGRCCGLSWRTLQVYKGDSKAEPWSQVLRPHRRRVCQTDN